MHLDAGIQSGLKLSFATMETRSVVPKIVYLTKDIHARLWTARVNQSAALFAVIQSD